MAVCPYCQTERRNPLDRCPKCGRGGSEPPRAHGFSGEPPKVEGAVIYEVEAAAMVAPGPEIELDIKPSPSGVPPPVATRGGSFFPAAVATAVPIMRSLAPPPVDPIEARLAGKFGPSPEHWWQTPGYARKTKQRLRELGVEVDRRRDRDQRARRAHEDALIAIAVRGVAVAATLPKHLRAPYVATIDRIKAAEGTLRKLDAAAAAEMDVHAQKGAALEARLGEFEHELALAQIEEREVAKLPVSAARDDRAARLKLALDEVRHKLAVAREEKSSLEAWQPVVRSASAEQARKEYRATCADFGRFVVDDTANFGSEFDAARKEIIRLDTARQQPKKELAVYEAALTTYDQIAVDQGTRLVYTAIALGVGLVALVAFLATR